MSSTKSRWPKQYGRVFTCFWRPKLKKRTAALPTKRQATVVRTDALKIALAALREQEHFREVTKMAGWISVEERLPDSGRCVIIYSESGGASEGHYQAYTKEWVQFRWGGKIMDVTHWMPLPEPPKEGAEGWQ